MKPFNSLQNEEQATQSSVRLGATGTCSHVPALPLAEITGAAACCDIAVTGAGSAPPFQVFLFPNYRVPRALCPLVAPGPLP